MLYIDYAAMVHVHVPMGGCRVSDLTGHCHLAHDVHVVNQL